MAEASDSSDISENTERVLPEKALDVLEEPLDLSKSGCWPHKVFVPSDPIPIPVTPTHDNPFVGTPSPYMFDRIMREAWHKHSPDPLITPGDKLSTKRVDRWVLDRVKEEEEVMEKVVNKKVETLKTESRKLDKELTVQEILEKIHKITEEKVSEKTQDVPVENKEEAIKEEYLPPKKEVIVQEKKVENVAEVKPEPRVPTLKLIKYPNMLFRLAIAINYLTNPETHKDTLFIPPDLTAPWTDQLMEIQAKRAKRQAVSLEDFNFYASHKGYIYLPNIMTIKRMLIGQRYASSCNEIEFERIKDGNSFHPLYCRICNVVHYYTTNTHPQQCLTMFTNGPRLIADLKEDNTWRTDAQAVCLGVHSLMYMPYNLKHRIINVGNETEWDYSIPRSESSLYAPIVNNSASLVWHVNNIITLLGPDVYIPILVEFYENPKYPAAGVELHMAGFANALRYCQSKYNGPIIGIIPPVLGVKGDTHEIYYRKKERLAIKQKVGHLIGQALGVPIIHIPAQITEYTECDAGLCYPHWNQEPLVTDVGSPTREYFQRVELWFDYFLANLFVSIPIPTLV